MNAVERIINENLPQIRKEVLKSFGEKFQKVELSKNQILLNQGEVCKKLFFLSRGICRYYTYKEGDEVTTWFGFSNDFVTSFTSFFPGTPSYETIELLSDSELYFIHEKDFNDLKVNSSTFQELIIHFISQYTYQVEMRLLMIQTSTASEKYQYILNNEPELVLQIPNKHLASYLGVSRETLSRIRSSIN